MDGEKEKKKNNKARELREMFGMWRMLVGTKWLNSDRVGWLTNASNLVGDAQK
jgi:hypothetical protein